MFKGSCGNKRLLCASWQAAIRALALSTWVFTVWSEERLPLSPRPGGCGFAKGKVLSAWSVTECVKFWNKMTFHSNLVVSGVFINKDASLCFCLCAPPLCWHNSAPHQCLGTNVPLADSLAFPLQLCNLPRESNHLATAACWLLAAFARVTRWCVITALCLPSFPRYPACPDRHPPFMWLPRLHRLLCLLILKFSVQTPPPLLSHTLISRCQSSPTPKCPSLLSKYQSGGDEEAAGPPACAWCIEALLSKTQFMCLLGKAGQKCWTLWWQHSPVRPVLMRTLQLTFDYFRGCVYERKGVYIS